MTDEREFLAAVERRAKWVDELLLEHEFGKNIGPEHLQKLTRAYVEHGGKRLRPAVLLFCCGAVGGDEKTAVPAAAAVELFHTWTLMHDDIIDQDTLRRGGPSGHALAAQWGRDELSLPADKADHYGTAMSILAGDVQHGLCVFLLLQANAVAERVRLHLVEILERDVVCGLVEGETLDIQLEHKPLKNVTLDEIIRMTRLKTAVLYEFAARAGAMIGLNITDENHQYVQALGKFCRHCGIAFQLQDDILGIAADEKKLGKPVGSDIIQGKRTTVVAKAYELADVRQKKQLVDILDRPEPTKNQLQQATDIISDTGAIDAIDKIARRHLQKAHAALKPIQKSQYTKWLTGWAEYMIEREF